MVEKVSINVTKHSLLRKHLTSSSDKLFPSIFAGKILLFYLIFYVVLALFFMGLWCLFATTLSEDKPKYELKDSIIGDNPGLGFRPMPPESNVESTLIWYEKNNANNSKYWVDEIDSFLDGEMNNNFDFVSIFTHSINFIFRVQIEEQQDRRLP